MKQGHWNRWVMWRWLVTFGVFVSVAGDAMLVKDRLDVRSVVNDARGRISRLGRNGLGLAGYGRRTDAQMRSLLAQFVTTDAGPAFAGHEVDERRHEL